MFPGSSVVFAQQIEKFLPYFYEDPIAPDSVMSMGGVGDKINIPLAVGERNNTLWEFREYCQQPGVGFLKPDIGLAGGFTHVKKIAAIAESFHIKMAPHHFLGPIANMANTHIATATPNWDVNEFSTEVGTFKEDIVTNVSEMKDGYFIPPEAPGLGIDIIEEEALQQNALHVGNKLFSMSKILESPMKKLLREVFFKTFQQWISGKRKPCFWN